MKKFTPFYWLFFMAVMVLMTTAHAQDNTYKYTDSWGKEGFSIEKQSTQNVVINFSINQFMMKTNQINGEAMQNIALSGSFLPNDAGCPDLPGNGRYIAIPQGSTPKLKIVSYRTETISNMDIAPAFVIPQEIYNSTLVYKKNMDIYSKNAFYPANPVIMSAPSKIRGIDVVTLGITPFQYNPVTKELVIYKDIKIEITFEGGNGLFGDNALRSRWFDPILEDVIFNYSSLPVIDYDKRFQQWKNGDEIGCEYLIIIPNNPEFSQWADSVKNFRTEQGIITKIVKLQDIPNSGTYPGIKTYITDAYNNWTIRPVACLLMGDYGINNTASTIDAILYPDPGYPNFACDNYYADATGDDLPDIIFSRMTANNAAQLQVQCTKFLNYERNPPMDPNFYDKPITALGWQDDRWFQLGSEIVGGYFRSIGKHPVRINALGSPASNTGNNVPGAGTWSTATNTTTVLNYFGPSGLNYIPSAPGTLGGFSGGTASLVNAAINNGTFMLQHRDHGAYTLWGEPSYSNSNVNSLTNVDNKLPFVFSINCETGAFHYSSECLAEKFHRYTFGGVNSGALGTIGAAEVSYSFVNDAYIWGMYDNMWPDFMPAYGTTPANRGLLPAFGNAAGKYFLSQSSWPYNTGNKLITYRLFHMFGDAFQIMYSEVPQTLTVNHANCVTSGDATFQVTANTGSLIALTLNGEILGTAVGTGSPVSISIPNPLHNGDVIVTITKQNYLRYSSKVTVVFERPVASFTYAQNELSFIFNNTSSNATGYDWDFGDGTAHSNELNPTHTYSTYGNYTLSLTATGICTDSVITELLSLAQGINENAFVSSNFFISPNPNNGIFNITANSKLNEKYNIKVLNALNVVIYENYNVNPQDKLIQSIDLSDKSSGVYYLVIENNGNKLIKKFTIQK